MVLDSRILALARHSRRGVWRSTRTWTVLLASACLTTACHEQPSESSGSAPSASSKSASSATTTNRQYYQAKGVVREVKLEQKSVTIQHEAVPGYMMAMTMPFDVKDTNELRGLTPGDPLTFRIVVAGDDAWIDQLKKLDAPGLLQPPPNSGLRITRDTEPLKVGDPLPDYHFTNQLGQAVNTAQFKGQALAFTFFFTRCPYPTFCPLMSKNFNETQDKLLALTNGPANWHLLSISFDSEFDHPSALKAYSERYQVDPRHWDFVTGDPAEISGIADSVQENFWREGGTIVHNLRTVVIDTRGRVQKIIPENKWTSDELVAEIVKAAGKQ